MSKKYLALFCLSLGAFPFLWSCDSSNGNSFDESLFEEDDSQKGFVKVNAAGRSVFLGTDDPSANAKERPQMKVKFDYDFFIGNHEVTCGEFNEVMGKESNSTGRESAATLRLDCENDSLPAVNLTYFDAALFANAKSKALGMDTAYSYVSASFSSKGNCTNLEGFVFHPEAQAYRLPTEAEWILAASPSWNPSQGWNSENSDYKPHEVCSAKKKSDSEALCDMAGNAMEWVNDWLGNFRDTTITNYVGAPDGGSLGQRVLKGGSYRNSPDAMKLFNRGDVYTVTSATQAAYVGFRLAYGKIPDAIWMSSEGNAAGSRIVTLANAATLKRFTKTYRTKLAFRNDISGNLAYVDYSNGNASVKEIQDTLNVFHPEISPDGRWVAFCTVPEGISKKSALYVRRLNAKGDALVKLDAESAAIPRWYIADGDTVIVYVDDPGNNEDIASFKKASTWQVPFANGKFGKPQKLFDGAYHGGISSDNTLAVSGSTRLRAKISGDGSSITSSDASDEIWLDSNQACNVSLSRGSSKQTMFLDFASKPGKDFVGEKYAAHQYLLLADSTGKLARMIPAPSHLTFDFSEWAVGDTSYHGIAVTALTNTDGAHTKIALVDTKDSSIIDLVEGEELWHPSLWFTGTTGQDNDVLLNLDSAGVYITEGSSVIQAQFRVKIERFWKHAATTEVLLMGSSRMKDGVKPDQYPERKMFNWAIVGIDPKRDFYFAKNYGLNHVKNLKTVVFSLDLDGWRGDEDHLSLLFDGVPGYKYDADHNFWVDYLPENFIDAVEASYPAGEEIENIFSDLGGWKKYETPNQSTVVQVVKDSVFDEKGIAALEERFDDLVDFIELAAQRNVRVVGILFPLSDKYGKTGSYGEYGLQRSIAQKKIQWLDSLSASNKNFVLMDENKMGDHDYKNLLLDEDHLCTEGAEKMTARLDSLLGTLE